MPALPAACPDAAGLNDFDREIRMASLRHLAEQARQGHVAIPEPGAIVNLHCHTFFSFNAFGHSPSALAWLGKCQGFRYMGIVDFDVLDGVDEFFAACDLLELRGTAGIETRCFLPEFAGHEINSPGEPGVAYHMGVGFASGDIPASAASLAGELRQRARSRNLALLERVNAFLDPVTIDYQADVLPLTPRGNATERHMVVAYLRAAQELAPDTAAFWAERLELDRATVRELMGEGGEAAEVQNAVRAKLMKRGGVGYVSPGPDSFPTIAQFHRLIEACGALPCAAWLDGTSAGEQAMDALLDLLVEQGVVALNIIPDRNWNIADPVLKKRKLDNLVAVVALAEELDLPLIIGTEMNSFGQKLYDDLDVPELQPLAGAFLAGAQFLYGHTMLLRHAGLGYQSAWARRHLPERRTRNDYYRRAGAAIPPTAAARRILGTLDTSQTPGQILDLISSQHQHLSEER